MVVPQIVDGRIVLGIWLKGKIVDLVLHMPSQTIDLTLLLSKGAKSAALAPTPTAPKISG